MGNSIILIIHAAWLIAIFFFDIAVDIEDNLGAFFTIFQVKTNTQYFMIQFAPFV